MGDTSATGVGFTRNPATGEKVFYGEFLVNAQGEDVVAGMRTPHPIAELEKVMPEVYKQLREITTQPGKALSRHPGFRVHHPGRQAVHAADPQWQAHRSGGCAHRRRHGERGTDHARRRPCCASIRSSWISCCIRCSIRRPRRRSRSIAKGLPASPGAAVGRVVFTADEAVLQSQKTARDSGPRRNRSRRHSRHGSGQGNSDFARRHDQPRGGGRARHG